MSRDSVPAFACDGSNRHATIVVPIKVSLNARRFINASRALIQHVELLVGRSERSARHDSREDIELIGASGCDPGRREWTRRLPVRRPGIYGDDWCVEP